MKGEKTKGKHYLHSKLLLFGQQRMLLFGKNMLLLLETVSTPTANSPGCRLHENLIF